MCLLGLFRLDLVCAVIPGGLHVSSLKIGGFECRAGPRTTFILPVRKINPGCDMDKKCLAVLLAVAVFFAGCTSPPAKDNGNGQQNGTASASAKSELKDLFTSRAKEYVLTYEVTMSSPIQGDFTKEGTYYMKGSDRARVDTVTEQDNQTIEMRAYVLDKRIIMCGNEGGNWTCISMGGDENTSADASDAQMLDQIDSSTVERLADRTVAGATTRCYKLKSSETEDVYCISGDGVILYSESSSVYGRIVQQARSYSLAVEDSVFLPPAEIKVIQPPVTTTEPAQQTLEGTTFQDNGDAVCEEGGKPVIRVFSTTWCPHCKWIKGTVDSLLKEYVAAGTIAAYHWEVDIGDDTLTSQVETAVPPSELEVFKKYNPGGGVPTFIFGCKYVRVGNGYESEGDLAKEAKEFSDVISLLTA